MIRRPAVSVSERQLEIANKSPYSMWRWYQTYPLEVFRSGPEEWSESLAHQNDWFARRRGTYVWRHTPAAAIHAVDAKVQEILEGFWGPWGWHVES
jgi:hypothetical protein